MDAWQTAVDLALRVWTFTGSLYEEDLARIMVVAAIGLQALAALTLLAGFLVNAVVTAWRGLIILVRRE